MAVDQHLTHVEDLCVADGGSRKLFLRDTPQRIGYPCDVKEVILDPHIPHLSESRSPELGIAPDRLIEEGNRLDIALGEGADDTRRVGLLCIEEIVVAELRPGAELGVHL